MLRDVVTQFRGLNVRGERIAVMDGFPGNFADKRYSVFHKNGGKDNHFQGVQRLGNHLLVTGSFPYIASTRPQLHSGMGAGRCGGTAPRVQSFTGGTGAWRGGSTASWRHGRTAG
jgi:hypothetical protein